MLSDEWKHHVKKMLLSSIWNKIVFLGKVENPYCQNKEMRTDFCRGPSYLGGVQMKLGFGEHLAQVGVLNNNKTQ